ncbi:hypothetical protein [Spongiibacter sp.]|uniref:hypothetical protein n=1 Tax=Spongiibacter sp. TaxID=2024860 RepID=UPI0035697B93
MLILISQAPALKHACDIALTTLVFGGQAEIVLWPQAQRALLTSPALCQQLQEFGISALHCLNAARQHRKQQLDFLPLSETELSRMIDSSAQVLSF